jgi:hypothetical protein
MSLRILERDTIFHLLLESVLPEFNNSQLGNSNFKLKRTSLSLSWKILWENRARQKRFVTLRRVSGLPRLM